MISMSGGGDANGSLQNMHYFNKVGKENHFEIKNDKQNRKTV